MTCTRTSLHSSFHNCSTTHIRLYVGGAMTSANSYSPSPSSSSSKPGKGDFLSVSLYIGEGGALPPSLSLSPLSSCCFSYSSLGGGRQVRQQRAQLFAKRCSLVFRVFSLFLIGGKHFVSWLAVLGGGGYRKVPEESPSVTVVNRKKPSKKCVSKCGHTPAVKITLHTCSTGPVY